MTDPARSRSSIVLVEARAAGIHRGREPVFAGHLREAVNLSLEHGNSDGSCFAYVCAGAHRWSRVFGDYQARLSRSAELGYDLVERARTAALPGPHLPALRRSSSLPWTTTFPDRPPILRAAPSTPATRSRRPDLCRLSAAFTSVWQADCERESRSRRCRRAATRCLRSRSRATTMPSTQTIRLEQRFVTSLLGRTPRFGCRSTTIGSTSERRLRRDLARAALRHPASCFHQDHEAAGSPSCRRVCGRPSDAARQGATPALAPRWRCPMKASFHFFRALTLQRCILRMSRRPASSAIPPAARAPAEAARSFGRRHCPENFENRARAGRRGDRPHRRPRARGRAPLRAGHPLGRGQRLRPQRGARLRTGRALLRGARLREDRDMPICGMPATAICAGEPMGRCGSSMRCTRTSREGAPALGPTEHDRDAGRASRPRDRDQGLGGGLGRDRAGEADRYAHAHGHRACGRRAGLLILAAR